jgi:predicted nucleic acid-binding protein
MLRWVMMCEGQSRRASFRETLKDLLRAALVGIDNRRRRRALRRLLESHETNGLAQPGVVPLHPGPRHREILEKLVIDHGAIGPLVTDAVLAALAIEYGASPASTNQNFRRFPELRWLNPLSA